MKTFRLMTALVLVVGLIGVFPAFGAKTTTGQKENAAQETQESQDQQKGSAPGSTSIKAPAASAKSQPLAIQKLSLKEGTVHVVLATKGSGKVRSGDYARVKLTVEMTGLKKPGEWTLLQVDPKRRLTRLRGTVDFDTGLEVKAGKEKKVAKQVKLGKQVKATLSFGLWKTTKQETLVPMKATVAVKTSMAAGEQNKGTTHRRVSASRLPIEILTPHTGRIFRRGQIMHIRYRIVTPTEAGEVTFRLLSPTHGEVATTTHHYEPPDLSGVDWSEVELEPVGPGSLGPSEPDDGEPLGIGDVVLTWTLPSGDSLPYADDYYFRAHKGGLQGRSATFRIAPPASLYSGTGIDVDVLGSGLTPGSDLVVRYYCWGCDCERVNPPTGTRIYLHRAIHGLDSRGVWRDLGSARSGSEITETLRIPEGVTPAFDYVITLWGGSACWGESNTFPILASSTETDFRVIRPNGGEGWQLGTTQLIRWSVANLFGAGSSESDARYAIELLRDGAPVDDISTSGIAYDSATRTCSVPWEIPPYLSNGTRYKVRIQATNRAEPGGATLSAESAENFTICADCMVEDLTSATDFWIEGVQIGSSTGPPYTVDYYTDRGSTSLSVAVRVRWNHERPLAMCRPVVRLYRSDRGYSSIGDGCSAREFPIADPAVAYIGFSLQPGLTPGSTIPLRAEIVCGNEALDARSRSALDICECCTGNNQYDFSVTLRDAGSR